MLKEPPQMPEFALANFYYYANETVSPDVQCAFDSASPFDLTLSAAWRMARITHRFNEARKGNINPLTAQGYTRGHTVILPQRAAEVRDVLPPSASEVNAAVCALFVGQTEPTTANISKLGPIMVNKDRVRTILDFLFEHNPFYRDSGITFSEANLNSLFGGQDVGIQSQTVGLPKAVDIAFLSQDNSVHTGASDYTGRENELESMPRTLGDELLMESVAYTEGDHTPVNFLNMKATATKWVLDGRPFVQTRSGSNPMNERHPAFLSSAFPQLDPFGLGSLCHPLRKTSSSFERQVNYLLCRHNSRFASDPTFPYVCWDIINRAEVNETMSFRVKERQRHRIAEDIKQLSPAALERLQDKWAKNPEARPETEEEKHVVKVLKSLKEVTHSVRGSAGSKLALRNRIRGLMNVDNTPAVFLTINPFDTHHPLVRVLVGDEIVVDDVLGGETLDAFNRALLVSKNPAAAARFFHIIITTCINLILRPKNGPGLLGYCKGYFGTVEAQGRGTLHCHMLIWLEGNPNPQLLREKLQDKSFRDQMFAWLESIILTEPVGTTEIIVPASDARPRRPADMPNPCAMYMPQIPSNNPPDSFWDSFRKAVNALAIQTQWHEHSETCWKYLKPGEPRDDAHCRMRIDGSVIPRTYIDEETGSIVLRRLHPRLNNFNDVIEFLLQCNMDIKYIGSGEAAKALVYYTTDYITKAPLPMHTGLAALLYGIRKHELRWQSANLDETDDERKDKNLIIKCVNAMTGKSEFSYQQVMSYLVGGGDHYTDRKFENLKYGDFDRWVYAEEKHLIETTTQGNHVSGSLSGEDDVILPPEILSPDDGAPEPVPDMEVTMTFGVYTGMTTTSQIWDYILRPEGGPYHEMCVWDFCAMTEKRKPTSSPSEMDSRGLCLNRDHPQFATHRMYLRTERHVPVLLGPSIPRRDDDSPTIQQWCRAMMVLFKPFRKLTDLKLPNETWHDAFKKVNFPPRLIQIMHNMNVQHECRDARNTFTEMRREGRLKSSFLSAIPGDQEGLDELVNDQLHDAILADSRLDELDNDPLGLHAIDDDSEIDPGSMSLSQRPNRMFDALAPAFSILKLHKVLPPPPPKEVSAAQGFAEASDADKISIKKHEAVMKVLKAKGRPSRTLDPDDTSLHREEIDRVFREVAGDGNVTVEQLQDTTVVHHFAADTSSQRPSNPVEEVADIVRRFGMNENEEQERAFTIVGEQMLSGSSKQLIMYLSGVGGTGKSHVIKAVLELFRACGISDALRLSAPTGIAAVLISGYTIHSLILKNGNKKSKGRQNIDTLQSIWRGVNWLILDEISMVSAELLHEISERISLAKGYNETTHDKPFGGLNILFTGDFAQLRPPERRGGYLYSNVLVENVRTSTLETILGQAQLHGVYLWRQVQRHVALKKNWRQLQDPKYGNLLSRVRIGAAWNGVDRHTEEQRGTGENYDRADIDILESRFIGRIVRDATDFDRFAEAPVIVGTKAIRDEINELRCSQLAVRSNSNLDHFVSIDRQVVRGSRKSRPVPFPVQERLWRLPSNTSKDSLGKLPLVCGMKIMITENLVTGERVVNGAEGELVGVRYQTDGRGNKMALCAYVHIPGCPITITEFPTGVVPIVPTLTSFTYESLEGGSSSISRRQLPMLPAFSYTDYKSQSRTLESAIVDLDSSLSLQGIYVMLSRIKSLSGLAILRPFNPRRLSQNLSQELRNEFKRLKILEDETTAWYNNREPLAIQHVSEDIKNRYERLNQVSDSRRIEVSEADRGADMAPVTENDMAVVRVETGS